jgi:hypothetical protein
MHPILATTALSAAGNIVHNIADRIFKGPAKTAPAAVPAVPFSTLVAKASAPTAVSVAQRAQALSTKLTQSAEVAAAANGAAAAGPLSLHIDAAGDTALRLPNGDLKPIRLSEEMRGVARELHHLRQPAPVPGAPGLPKPVIVALS